MPRFKVRGSLYEPGAIGANKDGYVEFFDTVDASSEDEARVLMGEDYGEYCTILVEGTVSSDAEAARWLERNPD